MAEFDQQYLGNLVLMAQRGNKNAFAELYAATYQREYYFCYTYLKDIKLATAAVQETYIFVLKNLLKLRDPGLFLSWLNQICFRVCFQTIERQKMEQYAKKHSSKIAQMDTSGLPVLEDMAKNTATPASSGGESKTADGNAEILPMEGNARGQTVATSQTEQSQEAATSDVSTGSASHPSGENDNPGYLSPEDERIMIEGKEYLVRQILSLPFAESQALILKYYQKMSMREIATLMDIGTGSLKRCIQSGLQRLAVISVP